MYSNFFQFPLANYKKQPNEPWDNEFYENVVAVGAPVKGYNNRKIRTANMNRATFAQLIAFAHGKEYDVNSAVTYLMDAGISTGQNPKETIPANKFGANNNLKRSQAALFLYRMYKNNYAALNKDIAFSKSFNVGANMYYVIKNSTSKAYEVAIMHNGKQVGGYVSKPNTVFEDFMIGTTSTNTPPAVAKNGKAVYPLVDTFDRKLYGVYWEDLSAKAQFDAMAKDMSATKMQNLSKIAFDLTNNTRLNKGLNPLSFDYIVKDLAKAHSDDMVKNNFWSHSNLKGENAAQRYKNAGIPYREMAENLAQASNIFSAHYALLNSASHRKTILNGNLTYVGIGAAAKPVGQVINLFVTYNYVRY